MTSSIVQTGQPVNVKRLVDLVRISTHRHPAAPALEFDGSSYTYAEILQRSMRLARALLGGGLRPGDATGILLGNAPEYLETYLALQLAGLVAVPVNFRLVGEEVAYILGNCEARALIIGEEYSPLLAGIRDQLPKLSENSVVVVGGAADHPTAYERVLTAEDAAEPTVALSPFDPASIFYTSGTTGFPKGAVMSHLNVLARLVTWAWEFGITAEDAVLIPGPVFHMSFSSIALLTLAAGGRVILMKEFDAEAALEAIQRYRVTWSFLVPKMLALLLDALGSSRRKWDTASLRGLLSSGSPLSKPALEQLFATFPGVRIADAYGWTETGWLTICRHGELLRKERSVGRAAFACEVTVLDEEGRHLPPGSVGEIYAANPVPFLGYYNNPDATAGIRRGKWETGGDMGLFDEEGFLYIVDRKKDMIVSGGENLYPAEIERVVAQHPKVQEVAVVGVPDERWGESPRACVVLRSGETATPEEILSFCNGRLARYKHPRSVEFLSELPRNAMGKVLRRELRDSFWAGHEVRVQ